MIYILHFGDEDTAYSIMNMADPLAMNIRHFDPQEDPANCGKHWEKWIQKFEMYVVAKQIEKDEVKVAQLLLRAGESVFDTYMTLKEEADKYADVKKKLTEYYKPMKDSAMAVYVFREEAQKAGETVDTYVTRLKNMANDCEFTDSDSEVRAQVLQKTNNGKLRREILKHPEWKLADVLKEARAIEASEARATDMERARQVMPGQVQAVGTKPWKQSKPAESDKKGKNCFACGGFGHYARDRKCPAKNFQCKRCSAFGHYTERCRSNMSKNSGGEKSQNCSEGRGRGRGRGLGRGQGRGQSQDNNSANFIDEDSQEDSHYAFNIGDEGNNSRTATSGEVTIRVGGVTLNDVVIDSGATTNVMSQETWESLKRKKIRADSETTARTLFAYGSQKPLQTVGTIRTQVIVPANQCAGQCEFIVVKGRGKTLMGKQTAEELNLLRVGPQVVNSIVSERCVDDLKNQFKPLFNGVGLLKGYKMKLHIDDNINPIAQPVRRIPFGLREKVDKKLDELLEQGIIEEVPEGPTGWVSPLVVVPKPGGDVRVCVDMRRANEAIVRERHPIPTVDELMEELSESTVFSKVDLKWGFHQVELEESSRHITTFCTHRGLYRYRRLMFGLSSAPEKYNKIVRDVLRGCEGVANIADDIIIHGRGIEQHDQRLFRALKKIQDAGMTLNKSKCEFRLRKITFFGHEVTDEGVKPSQDKVEAIINADPPGCASEARSFMGLVQFSAKFIPDLSTVAAPIQEVIKKK